MNIFIIVAAGLMQDGEFFLINSEISIGLEL